MRVGLGNTATLFALLLFGPRAGVLVTVVRTILGALIVGTLLTPIFVLSFGGGVCSIGAMIIVHRRWPRIFSIVGVSIWGALAHNIAQLLLVYLLFIKSIEVLLLFPLFLVLSITTGAMIGLLAYWSLEKIVRRWELMDT